jgi:thiol peroxidase
MAKVTLKGNFINTIGNLPLLGSKTPSFTATKTDLTEIGLNDFQGKKVIFNIFPSLDTATCAMSVRKFNEAANKLKNTVILCISADLPFAQQRFCGAENLKNVMPLSIFRHTEFGKDYGVTIIDGPLKGLLARAVVIVDESGKVIYTQQVSEIIDEPDYQAALKIIE